MKQIPEPQPVLGYQMDPSTPLHQLFLKRMYKGRDLKIIITAKDSSTGTGKTTLAGWLALTWNPMFAKRPWRADDQGTLIPTEYFKQQRDLPPGSVLILDDAEELDARRSMKTQNVEFSQRWMLMRVRQIVSILTLPSLAALDSRLEELADVWINVQRRGKAQVHGISVQSYGSRKVMTPKKHTFTWPNVADHPELVKLQEKKQEKIDGILSEMDEPEPDPEEVETKTKKEIAQRLREEGRSARDVGKVVGKSHTWVLDHTAKEAST